MHTVNHGANAVNRRAEYDAVPKVEDVPRPVVGHVEYLLYAPLDLLDRRKENGWIKVALNPALVTDGLPRLVKTNAPVHAGNVSARLFHYVKIGSGIGAEVDERHAFVDRLDYLLRVRKGKPPVVLRPKASGPAVKELHSLGPASIWALR